MMASEFTAALKDMQKDLRAKYARLETRAKQRSNRPIPRKLTAKERALAILRKKGGLGFGVGKGPTRKSNNPVGKTSPAPAVTTRRNVGLRDSRKAATSSKRRRVGEGGAGQEEWKPPTSKRRPSVGNKPTKPTPRPNIRNPAGGKEGGGLKHGPKMSKPKKQHQDASSSSPLETKISKAKSIPKKATSASVAQIPRSGEEDESSSSAAAAATTAASAPGPKQEQEAIPEGTNPGNSGANAEMYGGRGGGGRGRGRGRRGRGRHGTGRGGGGGGIRKKGSNTEDNYPVLEYSNNKFKYQVMQFVDAIHKPDDQFPVGVVPDEKTRLAIHKTNYHLRQNQTDPFSVKEYTAQMRLLGPNFPRRKYRRRKNEFKSVNHWAQRKTVVQEIEFLTKYAKQGDYIVYIGAAPAMHFNYLVELFPTLTWELYDLPENKYHIEPSESVRIHTSMLTEDDLKAWAESRENVLLISGLKPKNERNRDAIYAYLDMQETVYKAIQPRKALLRFELPWGKGRKRYLDGRLYLPVWGTQTSLKTYLVPYGVDKQKNWDLNEYEEWMFYFNTVHRVQYYRHNLYGLRGVDHCYDCASEEFILRMYLMKYHNIFVKQWERNERHSEGTLYLLSEGQFPSRSQIKEQTLRFMKQLCKVCSTSSHREMHYNPPPAQVRARWFYGDDAEAQQKRAEFEYAQKNADLM